MSEELGPDHLDTVLALQRKPANKNWMRGGGVNVKYRPLKQQPIETTVASLIVLLLYRSLF